MNCNIIMTSFVSFCHDRSWIYKRYCVNVNVNVVSWLVRQPLSLHIFRLLDMNIANKQNIW